MREIKFAGIIYLVMSFISCQSPNNFDGAIAVWSFAGLHDNTEEDSRLEIHGDVSFVSLTGEEVKASKARGGDGIVARINGGWLDAGQGINEELNLTGKHVSILLRIRADTIKGFAPIVNKAGNDQNIAYRISLNTNGDETYIESEIGSDEIAGAHVLKYKLPKEKLTAWHDIVFRFNGKLSELFVDGQLRDAEVSVGEIRNWNRRPLLIGAQYKQPYEYENGREEYVDAGFEGLIDHIAIWNSYLSDAEIASISGVTELNDGRPEYYTEIYRPQFHFSAKKNWINDPNGLVYYNGTYHLFFQYMPPHRPGAYKDWGHAVSRDLVHWEQIPNHITPHKVWGGCWSGSAVVDKKNAAGFQNGNENTIVAFITNGGEPDPQNSCGLGPMCTQCIAYSVDGGQTFTYYDQNPVIKNISKANRDPKIVWDEVSKQWIMSLFMDIGCNFSLFASSNLKEWKYLSTVNIEGVRECPGFEPLPVDGSLSNIKWIFWGANGNYIIGSFDGVNFIPETKVLRGDYGINYYAAQSWSDMPDGRCVIIAWMPTQHYPDMPFEQQLSFPTELTLRNTSTGIKAFRMPAREIQNLYDKEYQWEDYTLKTGNYLLEEMKDELVDTDLEFDVCKTSSFEIKLRHVTVTYDARKKILSCGGIPVRNGIIPDTWISSDPKAINASNNLGIAPLSPVNGIIKLRILVDRTSIEIFGNDGEIALTSCYMPQDGNSYYSITTQGDLKIVRAKAHSLKSAWVE